jgi:hypothetical protein
MIDCFNDGTPDKTKYRQCSLRLMEPIPGQSKKFKPVDPQTTRACWLPSAGLREGMLISLEGESEIYLVAGASKLEVPRGLLHTDWKCGENGEISKAPPSNFTPVKKAKRK